MKVKQQDSFELVVRTESVFEADRSDLINECAEVISECERANSSVLDAAQELTDLASNMIEFGSELAFLTQCLYETARSVDDAGGDGHDTAHELEGFARNLDDLTLQSLEHARVLLQAIRSLIDGD